MTKSKITKTTSAFSVSGGKGHMFGKSGVDVSKPGVSATPGKQAFDKKAPGGGKGHMFAKSGSRPAPAGGPPLSKPGAGKGGGFGVSGGKTKMFGPSGAQTARAK